MNISRREKILVVVLLLALFIYLFYNFIYVKNQEKIAILETEVEVKKQEVKTMMDAIDQEKDLNVKFKKLNFEISDMSKTYLPDLNQEKLIVFIDNKLKEYQIETSNINFSSPGVRNFTLEPNRKSDGYSYRLEELKDVYLGVNKEAPAEEAQEPKAASVENAEFDISFNADYYLLLDFIDDLQNNQFEVTLSNMNLTVAENNIMNGSLIMNVYSIPKLHEHNYMNWVWADYIDSGRSNPFFESDIQRDQYWTSRYDFVMNVKPISSDLPTVTLGEEKDTNRVSYIYADSNTMEDVTIEIKEEDGKYYYKYKTQLYTYPENYENWIEFTPNNEYISMEIVSEEREDDEDQSGVVLNIVNNTEVIFYVNILDEDVLNPRIEYSQADNVIYRVNQ